MISESGNKDLVEYLVEHDENINKIKWGWWNTIIQRMSKWK